MSYHCLLSSFSGRADLLCEHSEGRRVHGIKGLLNFLAHLLSLDDSIKCRDMAKDAFAGTCIWIVSGKVPSAPFLNHCAFVVWSVANKNSQDVLDHGLKFDCDSNWVVICCL
jgi:hypothetical protein